MRAPHLYESLRGFCLGAFSAFHDADLPFAFEEHDSLGRPTLYEYRPLVKSFIEKQADRLHAREDVKAAVRDLEREPAATVYKDHYRTLLVPLLVRTAEGCGGFDWDDSAFDRAYAELEQTLFGEGHVYGAVAPLIGLSCGAPIDLGDGIGLLPRDFGRQVDRTCVLELERSLAQGTDEVPDAPGELADAVTALRLATAAPVAAGPVLFERIDWRPYGIRPVLPIAATAPAGEPDRLDPFRASVAARLRPQLARADDDAQLGESLDRWELALFQDDPFRGEQLRHALEFALGCGEGTWAAAMRAAALLGETGRERADLADRFRKPTTDLVRRLLVAVLEHGDRRQLVRELDDALLGLRAGPARVAE